MANTYAFAIFGALMLAVTLAPVLCSFLFHNKKEEKDTFVDRMMKRRYLRALDRVLRPPLPDARWSWAGCWPSRSTLVPGLGGEFMPAARGGEPLDPGHPAPDRLARGGRADGAPAPRGDRLGPRGQGRDVARRPARRRHRRHQLLQPRVQRPARARWRSGGRAGDWELGPDHREEIQDELTEKFEEFPGVNFNFSQLIRDNVEEALSGVKGANSVKLFGNDLKTLEETGQRVVNILKTVRGIENVGLFHIVGQPNLEIQIDRRRVRPLRDQRGRRRGGRPGRRSAAGPSRRWSRGRSSTTSSCGCRTDLRDDPERHRPDPGRHPRGQDGKPGAGSRSSQLAKIDPHKPGASYIYRENNRRYIPIKFSVRGRDLASAIAEAQRKVERPEDGRQAPARATEIEWSGEFAQMQEANARLMWIVPLSIAPDHGPALHGVQLAEGRPPGHGQRGRRRRWGASGP